MKLFQIFSLFTCVLFFNLSDACTPTDGLQNPDNILPDKLKVEVNGRPVMHLISEVLPISLTQINTLLQHLTVLAEVTTA
jgi:hypothetical protein